MHLIGSLHKNSNENHSKTIQTSTHHSTWCHPYRSSIPLIRPTSQTLYTNNIFLFMVSMDSIPMAIVFGFCVLLWFWWCARKLWHPNAIRFELRHTTAKPVSKYDSKWVHGVGGLVGGKWVGRESIEWYKERNGHIVMCEFVNIWLGNRTVWSTRDVHLFTGEGREGNVFLMRTK